MTVVLPGQRLASSETAVAGPGTYELNGSICASITGTPKSEIISEGSKPAISVTSAYPKVVMPKVGSDVICKVTGINPRFVKMDIWVVDGLPLVSPFRAVLRSPDVRAVEKDAVQLHLCFKPGDIVRAKTISLGDAKSYFLSTAADTLGVIHAVSDVTGLAMVPSSGQLCYTEMTEPSANHKEPRKVASAVN